MRGMKREGKKKDRIGDEGRWNRGSEKRRDERKGERRKNRNKWRSGSCTYCGFLSIDCGLEESNSNYTDAAAKINYVVDGPYVDSGENKKVAAEYQDIWGVNYRSLNTLRSFPSDEQNCYALPTVVGTKYLVRLEFLYGNYDNKNSSFLEFNLTLGVNHWDTVSLNTTNDRDGYTASEAVFVAWVGWAPVCLVNTGGGTPFVSTLELRPLGFLPYPAEMGYQSLFLYERRNMGPTADDTLRYPDDVYDRFWYPWRPRDDPTYSKISTTFSIEQSALFAVPSTILQTAVVPVGKSTVLTITTRQDKTLDDVMVFLHLADFQNGEFRQFDAYIDDELFGTYNPQYNIGDSNFSNFWYSSTEDSKYNLTLAATAKSKLPPMLNAFEVYGRIAHDNPTTFSQDCKLISLEHTKPIKIHAMALHQTISKKQPCQQHSKKITQIFLIIKRI
uniref:Malectin-like domain-containing protein n=1 Tax=Oryza barthii TaxID=65489 RepID=A0A0D3HKG0_9ORYZ